MKELVKIMFWALILFTMSSGALLAQPRIANTKSRIIDEKLMITYDVLNSTPQDKFKIWVGITTKSGMSLTPKSLSGDVGDNVSGGVGKLIIWNLKNDNIMMSETFIVKVYGQQTGKATAGNNQGTNKNVKPKVDTTRKNIAEAPTELHYIGTGNALLRSAVFPGWGLSSMDKSKPYWLMGFLGYGAIVSSFYFNQQAVNDYNDYRAAMDIDMRDKLYNDVESNNKISRISAFSAVGIWAVNLIWTGAKAQKAKIYSVTQRNQKFLMYCNYDPLSRQPLLALRYTF